MRIIQSAWSCNQPDLLTANSGWLAPEYNLMAWTLSCLQLKNYYSDVVLYCDTVYAKMLIDVLQLPYSEVICDLDVLNKYHPQLWALPKIYSYSQQEKPFLHVDGDVFIWKKFDKNLVKGDLIAQNLEFSTDYYEAIMVTLEAGLTYFPHEILRERELKKPILAYNAGIFGGADISFFKKYTSKAFEFVDRNLNDFSKINVVNFNIFFEQYLFYCLAAEQGINVNVLKSNKIGDNQYHGFGDFARVPYEEQYLHLLGNYKRSEFICKQMANRLRQDHPYYYYKIVELFKESRTPLFKDYYFFLDNNSQKELQSRYAKLKENYKKNDIVDLNNCSKLRLNKGVTIDSLLDKKKIKALTHIQIEDLTFFCQQINCTIKKKFSLISNEYLYARDCNSNQYFQYLFEDINTVYLKKIIVDCNIYVINSKFEWSFIFEKTENNSLEKKELSDKESMVNSIIIPECDISGFSIGTLDQLDLIIMKIIGKTKTIRELFEALIVYFDEEELKESQKEFEKLIFGRIKQGLHLKYIRVVY